MDYMAYMDQALEEAKQAYREGEIPVGAVLVCDEQLISRDHNRREGLQDPTAHAEMQVIREGARKLGHWRLRDCTLVVTLEPCPMCASAISQARIKTLVYGIADPKTGAVESTVNLLQHPSSYHEVEVVAGIREDACRDLLEKGFARLREKRKEP